MLCTNLLSLILSTFTKFELSLYVDIFGTKKYEQYANNKKVTFQK